jgi:glycosyltransferase involved in cell wall biosynthesis
MFDTSLSVIIPAFNEEESIEEFLLTVISATKGIQKLEVIVVDDGSTDLTSRLVSRVSNEDNRIKLLSLMTNSGHMAAITAGLQASKGDWVVTIDADGQDDPNLIMTMLDSCLKSGAQICFMSRINRKNDPLRHRLFSPIFYKFLAASTGGNAPFQAADFRLMSRGVVEVLNKLPESNRVYRVLVPLLGFKSITINYERKSRHKGKSKYGFFQLATLGLRSMLATSGAPLRWISVLSMFFALISFFWTTTALVQGIVSNTTPGWASLAFIISLLFLFQAISTLVICEFLLILLSDLRKRPLYQVKES